jgi:hypothetical protein
MLSVRIQVLVNHNKFCLDVDSTLLICTYLRSTELVFINVLAQGKRLVQN